MALPKDFWEQLPLKTDAELCDMLVYHEDYLPDALAAAKDELSKRSLAPERVAQLEAEAQSHKEVTDAKAQEPLDWLTRIFIFIFCAGLGGLVLAAYYSGKGYTRKASDCWITLAIALGFYSAVAVFLKVFR